MEPNKREDLWRAYFQKGTENAYKGLIESYLPLVRYIAGRMNFKLPNHLDQEDLVSYGIFGLMEAVKKYDPGKGVRFETYASQRIRGAIIDALRQEQWVPRSVTDKLKEFQRVLQKFEDRGVYDVPESKLAEEMGISVEEIRTLMTEINRMAVTSLEDFFRSGDFETMTVAETLSDPKSPNPLSKVLEKEFREYLIKAVDELPEKDRLVISLYYYEELTLREIGKILGVSESRISQLHARAITKLRAVLEKYIISAGTGE